MLVCRVGGLKDEDGCSRQALAMGDPENRRASCYLRFYLPGWLHQA